MTENRKGRQTPTTSFVLEYESTLGQEAVDLYNKTGRTAQEWQAQMMYDIMAVNEDGLWTHTKFGWSVPRRNGKSEELLMRELWDNNQRFADAVQDAVTVGIMAGLRYDEMRDNLLHVIGMDDDEGARYRAKRLVMTECAYVANQGHLMGYQAEIEQYIFLATLDLRTSEICRSLDMKRFPVAEAQAGVNLPPMHPHCRSTTMPDMTDSELSRIQRFARDPVTGKGITVPGDMSYQEWYDKHVTAQGAQWRDTAQRNSGKDREQWQSYRAVLGADAPKSLEEFQRMKYTDNKDWKALGVEYRKAEIQSDIRAGKYELTINPDKQACHLLDSDGYIPGRSYLIYSVDDLSELQAYVRSYAGTGQLQIDSKGNWRNTEVITFPQTIGWVLKEDGTTIETNQGKIHYSKTGIHVVPFQKEG